MNKCRICFKENDLNNLFEEGKGPSLSWKLMQICNVKVESTDNLPSFLCELCANKVSEFYEFKTQVEASDKLLRSTVSVESAQEVQVSFLAKSVEEQEVRCEEGLEPEQLNASDESKTQAIHVDRDVKKTHHKRIRTSIQCSTCGKLVSSAFRLKCHMRIHTGEKPFACSVCQKPFTVASNLKIHERVHTGEKPLECPTCKRRFAQSAGLIAHMRLHTGENPYTCQFCSKKFKTHSHLQYHIRAHSGEKNFICQECNKAFLTRSDLLQHERTHTDERTHVCTICGMCLKRAYHLKRHMTTHTGAKQFRCDTCGLSYCHRYDLKRHLKRHANESEKER